MPFPRNSFQVPKNCIKTWWWGIKHSFLLVFVHSCPGILFPGGFPAEAWTSRQGCWVLHISKVLLLLMFPFPLYDSANTIHWVAIWWAFLLWFWICYISWLGLDALLVVSLNTTAHDEFSSFEFGKGFDYRTHLTIGMRELGKKLSQYLVSCRAEMQLKGHQNEIGILIIISIDCLACPTKWSAWSLADEKVWKTRAGYFCFCVSFPPLSSYQMNAWETEKNNHPLVK